MNAYEFATRCRDEPQFFCEAVMKWYPTPAQVVIMNSVRDNRRTAVKSAHAVGKSSLSARIALWYLMTHPHSIVYTTAPTMRQVQNILWQEIRDAWHSADPPFNGTMFPSAPHIEIAPKWWAQGFSTDNPDSFQGLHADYVLGIFDEAPGIDDPIWDASDGNLAGGHARFLAIGNPTNPSSRFYKECMGDQTNTITISAYDTPNFTTPGIIEDDIKHGTWKQKWAKNTKPMPYASKLITPEYVEGVYNTHGPESPIYKARVLGEFPDDSKDSLIRISDIEAAKRRYRDYYNNPKTATVLPQGPCVIGVDFAEQGPDSTVRAPRIGGFVYPLRTLRRLEPTQTIGEIINKDARDFPDATFHTDAIGVGSTPTSLLKEAGKKVKGIKVSNRSHKPEMFYDLKAEYYWALRQQFVDGTIAIPDDDDDLADELSKLRVEYRSNGQIKMMGKDEMRKALNGRSPDRAEALMLAFASGVAPYVDYRMVGENKETLEPDIARQQTIRNLIKMSQGGGFSF